MGNGKKEYPKLVPRVPPNGRAKVPSVSTLITMEPTHSSFRGATNSISLGYLAGLMMDGFVREPLVVLLVMQGT
jgi:hypothetical protein